MIRTVRVVLVSLACLPLVIYGIWSFHTPHHINHEGFEKLQIGMTEAEVEAVLGRPAGDYAMVASIYYDNFHGASHPQSEARQWNSEEGSITVYFDAGRIVHTEYHDVWVLEEPFLSKVRRWLRL